MYKVLSGNFQDLSWSEKAIVSPIDLQLTCYGHRPHEKVLYVPSGPSVASSDSSTTTKFDLVPDVTNAEVFAAAQPDKPGLTYVYDNFDWDHCKERGFDFRSLDLRSGVSDSGVSGRSGSSGSSSRRRSRSSGGSDSIRTESDSQEALSSDETPTDFQDMDMWSTNAFTNWMVTSHPSFAASPASSW